MKAVRRCESHANWYAQWQPIQTAEIMPILKRTDVELYYEVSGHGIPVLLIQGVGVVGECWRPQVNGLSKDFRTLLFDNRGIGKSLPCTGQITIEAMAQDARALMDAAGWESAHVVGHSMGGVIAQQLALDCPKRVRSLSLLCTFGRAKDAARPTPWVLWMTLRTRIGTRPMRRRAFLEMLWPADELRTADTVELAARVAALVGRDLADQPPVLMKQLQALSRHDTSKRLRELNSVPTLVVSAEHDPIALPRYGRALADGIAGAQFNVVRGAAHGVTIHKADAINRMIESFFNSVVAAKTVAV
jgi:pimeloyl-ACP methyl ester carboxylesterase